MNRNNDPHDVLTNLSTIKKEILQLCNARGSETTDFHALGFDCLLKKLREIEKILTGLKAMPITAHSTPHGARYQPVPAEPEMHVDRICHPDRPNPERVTLSLPDDLTPHTKQVLNEIYAKFERSFDEFYENAKLRLKQSFEDSFRKIDCYMNSFREKQKAEIRTFIENVLEDSAQVPPVDSFLGDLSYIPPSYALPHPQVPVAAAPPPASASAPMINMEAVRQTLECPGVDPALRNQFFAQLNDLNDVLTEIVEQADRRCPMPPREFPTRPPTMPEALQGESEDQFQPLTCDR